MLQNGARYQPYFDFASSGDTSRVWVFKTQDLSAKIEKELVKEEKVYAAQDELTAMDLRHKEPSRQGRQERSREGRVLETGQGHRDPEDEDRRSEEAGRRPP